LAYEWLCNSRIKYLVHHLINAGAGSAVQTLNVVLYLGTLLMTRHPHLLQDSTCYSFLFINF